MRYLDLPLLLHLQLMIQEVLPHSFAKVYRKTYTEDQTFWNVKGQQELVTALNVEQNTGVAKNVILFLGDGMSIPTLTAARIYKGQQDGQSGEEGMLSFETFPHLALAKTYNTNKQVADSASTATAFMTGVKTNYRTLGVDATVVFQNCSTVNQDNQVDSIIKWSQDAGKRTGFVTSTRVTHATPASTYAHVADRDWECDGAISEEDMTSCPQVKDVATQLVHHEPGVSLNVIMGGGYQCLDAAAQDAPGDPVDHSECVRRNASNLVEIWQQKKAQAKVTHTLVRNRQQLASVDAANTEYLLGLFANNHLPYEHQKLEQNLDIPTLAEMTTKAIQIMQQGANGYFLLVEGGRIDHAHHDTQGHRALDETVALDQAVQTALKMTSQKDTLIIVTADHAHTMSMSGYPARGQEIIGLAALGDDGIAYTTLMYANGPGYNYTVINDTDGPQVSRPNVTQNTTKDWDYMNLAAVPRHSETHGGDDVTIYATGPMAHLFHSLHEQSYIAHAMAYASCVGSNKKHCDGSAAISVQLTSILTLILALLTSFWIS